MPTRCVHPLCVHPSFHRPRLGVDNVGQVHLRRHVGQLRVGQRGGPERVIVAVGFPRGSGRQQQAPAFIRAMVRRRGRVGRLAGHDGGGGGGGGDGRGGGGGGFESDATEVAVAAGAGFKGRSALPWLWGSVWERSTGACVY